jgi:hypothetical protein
MPWGELQMFRCMNDNIRVAKDVVIEMLKVLFHSTCPLRKDRLKLYSKWTFCAQSLGDVYA